MGSIATKTGDAGETALAGGVRVSKASLRVEAYGAVDELTSQLGFARSVCDDAEIAGLARQIQVELFTVGSALATAPAGRKPPAPIEAEMVDRLTAEVHRIEAIDGIVADWSLSGGLPSAAAFDVARAVCRRAERGVIRLVEGGEPVQPTLIAYLNRLSDLLWLLARKLELDAGVNSRLRDDTGRAGNRWSRAW